MEKQNLTNKIFMGFIVVLVLAFLALLFGGIIIGTVVLILLCGFFYFFVKNLVGTIADNKENPLDNKEGNVSLCNLEIPSSFGFPYAVFNREGNLLFTNDEFSRVFNEEDKINIINLYSDFENALKLEAIKIGEGYYRPFVKSCDKIDSLSVNNDLTSIFFVDVTENTLLKKRILGEKIVPAFIFIDNYEEVTEAIEETSLPILTAIIERKLNSFATRFQGFIKKYEKDRYIFITNNESLDKIKESRFDILNEIKSVNIGEHIPVTISLGICANREEYSLEKMFKDAKAAIDLALGRGGDQAVIKEDSRFHFFGGQTSEVSRNARIRARVKAEAYAELINGSENVIVTGHKMADLDCFGASIGVYCIAKSLGKPCFILLSEISEGIRVLYEKLKAIPEYEGVFINEEEALRLIKDTTLLTVVDTHRTSYVSSTEVVNHSKRIVIFDHHRRSADTIEGAVLTYHEPYASSSCELISEMIQYLGERIRLTSIEADALLAGITLDTKGFGIKTGAITFEAAGYLKRKGADGTRVRMFFREDISAHKAKASAIKNAEIYFKDIAISVCPNDEKNTSITAAQAADELLYATGIRAAFVICKINDTIFGSARSFGEINVQIIAEKMGGGGHATVSGFQATDLTIDEVKEKLINCIEEYLREV